MKRFKKIRLMFGNSINNEFISVSPPIKVGIEVISRLICSSGIFQKWDTAELQLTSCYFITVSHNGLIYICFLEIFLHCHLEKVTFAIETYCPLLQLDGSFFSPIDKWALCTQEKPSMRHEQNVNFCFKMTFFSQNSRRTC